MSFNLEYLYARPGILKIVIVVFTIIAASSGSEGYYDSPYTEIYEIIQKNVTLSKEIGDLPGVSKEIFFVVISFFCLIISFFYLLALGMVPELTEHALNRYIDTTYHIFASMLIFIAGFLMIFSAADIKSNGCSKLEKYNFNQVVNRRSVYSEIFGMNDECQLIEEKLVAGIFAQIAGILYAVTAAVIFKTKEEDLP